MAKSGPRKTGRCRGLASRPDIGRTRNRSHTAIRSWARRSVEPRTDLLAGYEEVPPKTAPVATSGRVELLLATLEEESDGGIRIVDLGTVREQHAI